MANRVGQFEWRRGSGFGGEPHGWEVVGPDGVVVAWESNLDRASQFAVRADALLRHYVDREPGVYSGGEVGAT